ncbi:MAG: hypothetical protein IKU79_04820 [Bacteroidaceae bacterium]|nr:hypothetical protein [Bacteroidaceae bacterium]
MKFSKIFLLAGVALAFASCSEKEEWNTSEGALVGMADATLVVNEAKGIFNLPISVTGNRNAEVQITVEVSPVEETDKVVSAIEDVNYLVTSKVIKVPADKTTGNIEIKTVDDVEINNNRQFIVTVVSVEGATIDENNKSTLVTLKDNDSNPYDRLAGAWYMNVVSDWDGPLTFDVTVITDEEGGSAYEKYCIIQGLSGYSFMTARLDYSYNESTEEGYVEFPMPYVSVESVNFGSFVGDIHLYGVNENNQLLSSASIRGVWNDDMSEITFEATPKMGMVIVVGGQLYGWWDRFVVAKMVKK